MKFNVGQTYATRSICDHNCIFKVTIRRRTAKSVWIDDPHTYPSKKIVRREIGVDDRTGVETIMPFGRYSMAACIHADDPANHKRDWDVIK